MFSGRDPLRITARPQSDASDEDFLEDAGADAPSGRSDFLHAGTWIRNPLLRIGCCAGTGVYTDRLGVSVFRDVSWMAGRCADRKRYIFECALRQPAAYYL